MAVVITFKEMYSQWSHVRTHMDQNLENIRIVTGPRLVKVFRTNIASSSFFGKKWRDIKDDTKKRRTHRRTLHKVSNTAPFVHFSHDNWDKERPLLETGNLYDSITSEGRRRVKGIFTRVFLDPRKFRGPDQRHSYIYGGIHNDGGKANLPRRQFIGLHPDAIKITDSIIREYLFMGIPGSWSMSETSTDRELNSMMQSAKHMFE